MKEKQTPPTPPSRHWTFTKESVTTTDGETRTCVTLGNQSNSTPTSAQYEAFLLKPEFRKVAAVVYQLPTIDIPTLRREFPTLDERVPDSVFAKLIVTKGYVSATDLVIDTFRSWYPAYTESTWRQYLKGQSRQVNQAKPGRPKK
jgi:hypothetical protein